MTPAIIERIHKFLHTAKTGSEMIIDIDGVKHRMGVFEMKSGQRYMRYNNTLFIEQSTLKESVYANMAKAGSKITWMVAPGLKEPYARIVNNKFYTFATSYDFATKLTTPAKSNSW